MRGLAISVAVPEALIAIILVIWIVAAVRQPFLREQLSYWLLIGALPAFGLGLYTWAKSFVVSVHAHTLRYRSLFMGTKIIPIDEIDDLALEFGESNYMDRFRPPLRLVVRPKSHALWSQFDINLKPFSREGIAQVLALAESIKAANRRD